MFEELQRVTMLISQKAVLIRCYRSLSRSRTFWHHRLGAIVSALTLWVLGCLGIADIWAPPFRRRCFGPVSRHCC